LKSLVLYLGRSVDGMQSPDANSWLSRHVQDRIPVSGRVQRTEHGKFRIDRLELILKCSTMVLNNLGRKHQSKCYARIARIVQGVVIMVTEKENESYLELYDIAKKETVAKSASGTRRIRCVLRSVE